MLKKLRTFAKAKKGAELVEIIFGIVISVALLAVAVTYINAQVKEHASTAKDITA